MGVYINMEMPTGCGNCPCSIFGDCDAVTPRKRLTAKYRYSADERPDWCPLVPVPEHGWIPVTERLPGMYQQCWAACKMEGRENWVIEVQNYGIPYKKNPWGDYVLLESGEMQVYAWMPIDQPEPPKEET